MSSSEEIAEFGPTVSSACTSCGASGHLHSGIEALSLAREAAYIAEQDKINCARLREEMKREAACKCEQPAASSTSSGK